MEISQTGPGRRGAALWPLLLAAVITWESVVAIPSVGPPWLSFDKLAHFGVFGLLATTIARLDRASRWPLLGALWAIILVSLYGMGIEFLQSLTPMRDMEYGDWVADTLGAGTAVILYLQWTGYRRLLEWRIGKRPKLGGGGVGPPSLPATACQGDPALQQERLKQR